MLYTQKKISEELIFSELSQFGQPQEPHSKPKYNFNCDIKQMSCTFAFLSHPQVLTVPNWSVCVDKNVADDWPTGRGTTCKLPCDQGANGFGFL